MSLRYVWVRHPTGTAHLHLVLEEEMRVATRAHCGRPHAAQSQQLEAAPVRAGCVKCTAYVPAVDVVLEPAKNLATLGGSSR